MGQHRSDYKLNRGKSSAEVLKHGGAYIELIEKFPCEDREELCKREGEVMRATENCVNKVIAGRTDKEWRDDNKFDITTKAKKYHEDNREVHLARMKIYYQDNREKEKQRKGTKIRCECGMSITRNNISTHKKKSFHKTEMEILELAGEL